MVTEMDGNVSHVGTDMGRVYMWVSVFGELSNFLGFSSLNISILSFVLVTLSPIIPRVSRR